MTANGRHLALTGRRGTPPDWVEMSRTALGGRIDLDPMSEPIFNEIVRAERIITEQDNALVMKWSARSLFINPHGGLVVEAWRKLMEAWALSDVLSAIWIGFSMEQLNLLADEAFHPMDYSLLVVRSRIDFLTTEPLRSVRHRDGLEVVLECGHHLQATNHKQRTAWHLRCPQCEGTPEPLGAPTHGNYVVGIGIPRNRFEAAFAGRGRFSHGRYALPAESRAAAWEDDVFGGVG